MRALWAGRDWHGKRMGLILDHVNGERDDNRIENLRIVCPNCAATLETHCGRKPTVPPLEPRRCRPVSHGLRAERTVGSVIALATAGLDGIGRA